MKFASWNVNGIRACAEKGLLDWVITEKPDVFGLQETKAHPEQLSEELKSMNGYVSFWASAQKKGYSGVATFSNKKPLDSKIGIDIKKFDDEGRTIAIEFDNVIFFNCYFPNGQDTHARVPFKLDYCRELSRFARALGKKTKKGLIIAGDYNTAHQEIDLARPKDNINSTGFLPHERAWIDEFISDGFVDAFREKHPNEPDHYTWWSYRAGARQRNVGWRIDYFFVSDNLRSLIHRCDHRPNTLGSDHCPVILEMNF